MLTKKQIEADLPQAVLFASIMLGNLINTCSSVLSLFDLFNIFFVHNFYSIILIYCTENNNELMFYRSKNNIKFFEINKVNQ